MANVLRFVTQEKRSKLKKKISISSGCEIIIFPGIRYNRSENIEIRDENVTKRRANTVKTSTEPKRKRGT
jgi:hypothetical protein